MDQESSVYENESPAAALPGWLVIVLALTLGISIVNLALQLDSRTPQRPENTAVTQLQIEQVKLGQQMEKEAWSMRQAVLKACVDRGDLPFLVNGNVDCKPRQK